MTKYENTKFRSKIKYKWLKQKSWSILGELQPGGGLTGISKFGRAGTQSITISLGLRRKC